MPPVSEKRFAILVVLHRGDHRQNVDSFLTYNYAYPAALHAAQEEALTDHGMKRMTLHNLLMPDAHMLLVAWLAVLSMCAVHIKRAGGMDGPPDSRRRAPLR